MLLKVGNGDSQEEVISRVVLDGFIVKFQFSEHLLDLSVNVFLQIGAVDGEGSKHEDGKPPWLFVDVSYSIPGGKFPLILCG